MFDEVESEALNSATSGKNPIILFHYGKKRSGSIAKELLEDYRGALQIDGYDGYASAIKDNGILRLGCWAHARRKFYDAFKTSGGASIGKAGLLFIKKIYKIEEEIIELPTEKRFYIRLAKSLPIDDQSKRLNPESLAGKARKYARNEWDYLINFFTNGEYKIDNNYIESHIRPFTIGRKNWMFSIKPEERLPVPTSIVWWRQRKGMDWIHLIT
jgi:transposase